MRNEVAVVLNPYSGRGRGGQARDRIAAAFESAGLRGRFYMTEFGGHGIDLAAAARRDGFATVIAAGGDGTVSEVVNGLARAAGPVEPVGILGLLPMGSGNDFADIIGYPRNLNAAVDVIAAGVIRSVDLGIAEVTADGVTIRRTFNNNMGIGLEAAVTLESYTVKRLQGTPLYVTAALRTLRKFHAPDVTMTCRLENGSRFDWSRRTLLVTIGNSRRTGGGFYLTPDAILDDGLLDVGVAHDLPVRRVLLLLPKALFGKHVHDPAVTMLRGRELVIECATGIPVQLDGEVVATAATRVRVNIQPRRLRVLIPPARADDTPLR